MRRSLHPRCLGRKLIVARVCSFRPGMCVWCSCHLCLALPVGRCRPSRLSFVAAARYSDPFLLCSCCQWAVCALLAAISLPLPQADCCACLAASEELKDELFFLTQLVWGTELTPARLNLIVQFMLYKGGGEEPRGQKILQTPEHD